MKLTKGILAIAITMMAGGVWAQTPDAIDNARSTAKTLQQQQANGTNATGTASAKPAPGAPAPAVKPAAIPGTNAAATAAKTAPTAKPAVASAEHNQLKAVNVVPGADNIRVEISSSETVTPVLTKLDSPARILVQLPETIDATTKNHIAVGTGGVKGVRIGMDGKTPPTTSVVVDLEKACTYDLTPGSGGKVVLTLHTQAVASNTPAKTSAPTAQPQTVAKNAPAAATAQPAPAVAKNNPTPAKTSAPAVQPQTAAKNAPAPANIPPVAAIAKNSPTPAKSPAPAAQPQTAAKPAPAAAQAQPVATQSPFASKAVAAANAAPKQSPDKQQTAKGTKPAAPAATPAPEEAAKTASAAKPQPKPEEKKWAMTGKRDPIFSPVVQAAGSGCSTGKKCLEIGNINLRGVVKSDSGFIAVVTNNLNKAYFLRENDPVFNGYVVKITGDSVVFQETVEDKLGKPFTREIVKRIFTPVV